MALDFKECLAELTSTKSQLPTELYLLKDFDKLDKVAQNGILKNAENKFNYSQRTIKDFYGYLFQLMYEAGVSKVDGTEAAAMYVVYKNTIKVFPQFKELTLENQMRLLKEAHKKARKSERNLDGCAMNVYLVLVEHNLDIRVMFKDETGSQKENADSPWRATAGEETKWREYTKKFQNFKKLMDYDTGETARRHFPVWTSYIPNTNYRGVKRSFQAVDIWKLLSEELK